MKLIYPIWLIIFQCIALVPYIFQIRTWDFFATTNCIVLAILILVNIIYILVNMIKKHHIR
jgi:tryptophan-rich sensory protein